MFGELGGCKISARLGTTATVRRGQYTIINNNNNNTSKSSKPGYRDRGSPREHNTKRKLPGLLPSAPISLIQAASSSGNINNGDDEEEEGMEHAMVNARRRAVHTCGLHKTRGNSGRRRAWGNTRLTRLKMPVDERTEKCRWRDAGD
jgi:hypothetical protein